MNAEAIQSISGLQSDPMGTARELQMLMAKQSQQASELMHLKLQNSQQIDVKHARQQLESMHLNAERALSNETSTRALDEMFGKFSLVQKIMQSMG